MSLKSFLPFCDVLFNVISLAEYFCNVIFDLVFVYALYSREIGLYIYLLFFVIGSLLVSQAVSLKWFLKSKKKDPPDPDHTNDPDQQVVALKDQFNCVETAHCHRYVVILHVLQLGVLWRYAKLLVPVNLQKIKHEVRDLCMLRLLHAFCESAPMLLLQLHLLISQQLDESRSAKLRLKALGDVDSSGIATNNGPYSYPSSAAILVQQQNRTFKELNTISAVLSLFSICWALASFSKNVRQRNVHRLVLTWLGVIFQLCWRLGTVISRVTALTFYASLYHHWVFLVIGLHWWSMLLWLISPKNVFYGEKISRTRKTMFSAMIAFVYVFCYINLQEVNHRYKMVSFYVVMFLENVLLISLWMVGIWPERSETWYLAPVTVVVSFAIGIMFMATYYRFFHVRRLDCARPDLEDDTNSKPYSKYAGRSACAKYNAPVVPGVFNCRFTNPVHGATKRKKKKPTSFVPPPNLKIPSGPSSITNPLISSTHPAQSQQQHPNHLPVEFKGGGPMAIPFWKQPLVPPSQNGSSENESSVGSRVNIQQKLQEKKQKQLAELKVIEEEIKQGKLEGAHNMSGTLSSTDETRQPIPRIKKHDLDSVSGYSNMMALQNCYTDASDVDATYHTAYALDRHHMPQTAQMASSPFNATNNLSASRALLASKQMPRTTFHQNIQSNAQVPSPTQHHPDTNTSNSNKSGSNQSQSRGGQQQPIKGVLRQQQQPSPSAQFAYIRQQHRMTPSEVLLNPQAYLEQDEFYEWNRSGTTRAPVGTVVVRGGPGAGGGGLSSEEEEDNTNHPPSDIDSQMSRSYTLPREFKYNRKLKGRKMDNFMSGNNSSSDGDVDSVDDNESPANVSASKQYYQQNMTRRQQARNGRISVPAVGNQPIYLNTPHSYVRNLDLISNVLDGSVVVPQVTSPSRRMRYSGFRSNGVGGGGPHEVRHETKL